jgi:leader peptidase (prepilin peptidase)/N-methyltransferase
MEGSTGFFNVVFFVFGAIIGSFLNVVIHRIPRDHSIVTPGSRCPSCGSAIRFYDNIPIISYILLRGRCRNCGMHISVRYVFVELVTALIFSACFHVFGFSFELPVALVFSVLLIVISFIDLDFMIIPDIMSLGGLLLGIALSFFRREPSFLESFVDSFARMPFLNAFLNSVVGVILGGGLLFVIAKSYELLRKKEGMGFGDVKLLGMIGAFCGVKGVVFSLIAGSFIGTVIGIPLMLVKRQGTQYAVPFGPFLSLGALLYAVAGDTLIHGFFALISWG